MYVSYYDSQQKATSLHDSLVENLSCNETSLPELTWFLLLSCLLIPIFLLPALCGGSLPRPHHASAGMSAVVFCRAWLTSFPLLPMKRHTVSSTLQFALKTYISQDYENSLFYPKDYPKPHCSNWFLFLGDISVSEKELLNQ